MRILSVQTVKPSVNTTTSTYTQSSTYSQTSSSIMTGTQHQQHRRPSQKSTRLLQEMDNSAKELLAFLGELEDKRSSHTLEFVSRSDDTTRQIKCWLRIILLKMGKSVFVIIFFQNST